MTTGALMNFDLHGKRIWVAGHNGMVGSAVVRRLALEGVNVLVAGRDEVDLRQQRPTHEWVIENRPDVVIVCAAKVGGINANNLYPVEFLHDNLMIQANILSAANYCDTNRLIFLGSSCIYPKYAEQPIREESLLTGALEPTNEWYAIAKIAGMKLVQAYRKQFQRDWISAMPTNLYGPNDNYDLENSHVLPALIRKFHEAKVQGNKEVVVWGSGEPLREFMHCDDLADGLVFLLKNYSGDQHINVGSGEEISIRELARKVASVVYPEARICWDASKPDGTPRKLMDSSRLRSMGWNNCRTLETGLTNTYRDFLIRFG